jgi:hypothetical protein
MNAAHDACWAGPAQRGPLILINAVGAVSGFAGNWFQGRTPRRTPMSDIHAQGLAQRGGHARLSISGLGWGLSAALVVLFVLCMLAAWFLPLRAAHGWVALFSDAPLNSGNIWVEGLVWSVVIGWLIALVLGTIYNWMIARHAPDLIHH